VIKVTTRSLKVNKTGNAEGHLPHGHHPTARSMPALALHVLFRPLQASDTWSEGEFRSLEDRPAGPVSRKPSGRIMRV